MIVMKFYNIINLDLSRKILKSHTNKHNVSLLYVHDFFNFCTNNVWKWLVYPNISMLRIDTPLKNSDRTSHVKLNLRVVFHDFFLSAHFHSSESLK